MSKAHRGRTLKAESPGSARGNCPLCKRSGIKLLYELEIGEKKHFVCKQCNAAFKVGRFKEVAAAL